MKISVITVNLNDLQGLKKTLQSVVTQTYDEYELIVIDGGSSDGSKEYIAGLSRINQWVSEPDKGIYNAMNKAIALAHGEYSIFMNAGDKFYHTEVLQQVAPELNGKDFYVGGTIEVDMKGKERREPAPEEMSVPFLVQRSIYHQSTFTRTSLLKARRYSEDYKVVSDWRLFFKEWLNGGSYQALKPIVSYYYLGGFSAQNYELFVNERQRVIEELLPERIRLHFVPAASQEGLPKLERKIGNAMRKSPLKRDLAILRYGVKYLIKDIFRAVTGKRKS